MDIVVPTFVGVTKLYYGLGNTAGLFNFPRTRRGSELDVIG